MIVYLVNGKRLKVYGVVTPEELQKVYAALGGSGSRIKVPTKHNETQLIPASSVLRVVAKGLFS